MKLSLLATVFSLSCAAYAGTGIINKVTAYTPYVLATCEKKGVDLVGQNAMAVKKLSISETEDVVTLTAQHRYLNCFLSNNDSKEVLAWKVVDPFAGYTRQIYDFNTSKLITVTEKINSESKGDGFFAYLSSEDYKIAVAVPVQKINNELVAQVSFKKSDLLNQNDLDQLELNKTVTKTFEFSQRISSTTIFDNQSTLEGYPVNYSGRNIKITFKKANNQIIVARISK